MSKQPLGEPLAQFGGAADDFTTRPVIAGRRGVVASGHYLASEVGMHILRGGGNAVDAGVAMGFCLAVLEPHLNGIAGESPILIHHAASKRVVAINGQGVAPRAATIDWFSKRGYGLIPGDGLIAATVPSQPDNWITALAQFGTMSLETVLSPALDLARNGFPMYHGLRTAIEKCRDRFVAEWPGSAAIYLPEGRVPQWGDKFVNRAWADNMELLVRAERSHLGQGRSKALAAARDVFYRGHVAERIAEFCDRTTVRDATGGEYGGLLRYEDLAAFHCEVEEPVSVDYHGLDVWKCGPWTQGPVFLQMLRLLEGFDLGGLGHNSPDYIHTWIECAKLAFADREFYYGDPAFANVPLDLLLSRAYAEQRRQLIDPSRSSLELRPGDQAPRPLKLILGDDRSYSGDTTHLCAIDSQGNMIAATPSGSWIPSNPVIPELGFPLGTRAQMFSLDPEHPNALAPGKRPRTSLTPSLVTREGQPFMVFGTPGGDQQDQWTLQFFLNLVDFGMDIQQALDAPTFHSQHFPSSFYPRAQYPGRIVMEQTIPDSVRDALARRGHEIEVGPAWSHGRVLGVRIDVEHGLIFGGASPRGETGYAMGW